MVADRKINGLFVLTSQVKRIIRYIRIRLKTLSNDSISPFKKTVLPQKL